MQCLWRVDEFLLFSVSQLFWNPWITMPGICGGCTSPGRWPGAGCQKCLSGLVSLLDHGAPSENSQNWAWPLGTRQHHQPVWCHGLASRLKYILGEKGVAFFCLKHLSPGVSKWIMDILGFASCGSHSSLMECILFWFGLFFLMFVGMILDWFLF